MEIIIIILIILQIPSCFGMALIFKNIGLNSKKGLIPIYNKILLINKYNLPQYNLILIFIPLINLYTNYIIYKKICTIYNKDNLYVIELTLFPFIFNIFLGLELNINNLNKQKTEDKKRQEIEYTWQPKGLEKNPVIYKVSRKDNLENINIKFNKNEIIEDKINKKENNKKNRKECPNCKSKIPEKSEICPVCGLKI